MPLSGQGTKEETGTIHEGRGGLGFGFDRKPP